jgi:hypothetical protein
MEHGGMVLSNEKGLYGYEEGLEQNSCNQTVQFASFFISEVMRSFHLLTDTLMPELYMWILPRTSILYNSMLCLPMLNNSQTPQYG